MGKYKSLEEILGQDAAELTALQQGEFVTAKLGPVPFTALSNADYKQAKKDCFKMVKNGTGGLDPEVDSDLLMLRVIQAAVAKDARSTFTFLDKQLLTKLKVITGDQVVEALLMPGEIVNFAVDVQALSGFGPVAAAESEKAVKNS